MSVDGRSAVLGAVLFSPVKAFRVATRSLRLAAAGLFWSVLAVAAFGRLAVAWWHGLDWWWQLAIVSAVVSVLLRAPLLRAARRRPKRRAPAGTREPIPAWLRQQVIARDDGICGICGFRVKPGTEHIDHIHPVHAGGTNDPDNLQTSHAECNLRKGGTVGWQRPYRRESA